MQLSPFLVLLLVPAVAGCLRDGLATGAAVTGNLRDLGSENLGAGPVSCNALCVDTWSERAVASWQAALDPASSFTVEAWVYPVAASKPEGGVVVAHYGTPPAQGGYLLRVGLDHQPVF